MVRRDPNGRVVVALLVVRRAGAQGRAVETRTAWVSVLLMARPVVPMAVEDGTAVASANSA